MTRLKIPSLALLFLFLPLTPALAASALMTWAPNSEPDLAGYRIHYGTAPGSYATSADVGNVTSYTVPNLSPGTTYYLTVTAYDLSGNESTYATEVPLAIASTDTTAPTVTPPPAVTVEATGALTPATLGTATASDPEDGPVAASADVGGPFPPGVHTITWRATDSAGNVGSATQTVTVTDTSGPTVGAPPAVTVEASGDLTPATLGTASATDLVDGTLPATPDNTGPFPRGTHTIIWRAVDSAGNVGTATQVVTVTDTTAPVAPKGVLVAGP